ncbi:MAG: twin-arginine translocase TatA/TatE family subunit [Pyrinomonadaceae bacterium]
MYPLFLEFLGTTEVLVILVAALVLFGPRRLPELSRSLGKSLAQFKSASEDFKRTWEQEASLDQAKQEAETERAMLPEDDSVIAAGEDRAAAMLSATRPTEQTYARGAATATDLAPSAVADSATTQTGFDTSSGTEAGASYNAAAAASPAPSSKRDWL